MLAACDRQSSEKAQPQPSNVAPPAAPELKGGRIDRSFKGSRLPDFTLSDPKGTRLRLAELAGKPLLLNLWATWCAPCVLEMPTLDKLAATQQGKLRVLTVSQDMQGAEAVKPFFEKSGFRHLEPWLDPQNDLGFHFGGATLPMTVLYDSQGREIWRVVGGHDWSSKDSEELIAEANPR